MNGRFAVLVAIFLLMLAFPLASALESSSEAQFNTTPDTIRLNWTNDYSSNITIFSHNITRSFNVSNATNTVARNYSQPQGGSASACVASSFILPVKNNTGGYNITTPSVSVNTSTNVTITTGHNVGCPPGRYRGLLNITNSTNATAAYTNTTVILDVPIHADNILTETTGVAEFNATLDANATTYQSYFFNTSESSTRILNVTSVMVNLTHNATSNKNADIWLLDSSGNLLARSIRQAIPEALTYQYLSYNSVYEIRIYGNETSTIDFQTSPNRGMLIYSTLEVKEGSSRLTNKDLGNQDPFNSSALTLTINNTGNITQNLTSSSASVYNRIMLANVSQTNNLTNYTIRVGDFVQRIEVDVNWTGSADYNISLLKPDGTVVDRSNSSKELANVTGVEQMERVLYNSSVGFSDDGLWTVQVANSTNASSFYNVTARLYLNATKWVTTNFTAVNLISQGNTSVISATVNVSDVTNSTLSGKAFGNISFVNNVGGVITVPFEMNVTTPELLVNGTFNSTTIVVHENIGYNRLGANVLTLNVTINNTGNENLTIDSTSNSSLRLVRGSSTDNITFNYQHTSTTITSSGSGFIDINISINSTNTTTEGLYDGWIFLNETDSAPYKGFNLTLRVNLTDDLDMYVRNLTDGTDAFIQNATANTTLKVFSEIFWRNGTEITTQLSNNFTAYLTEGNTSYRIPTTGPLNITNDTNPVFESGVYKLNVTLTGNSSVPGGSYNLSLGSVYNDTSKSGSNLAGNVTNGTILINNTGLHLARITSSSVSVDEGETTYINITVRNLGTVLPTGTLTMSDWSDATITADVTNSSGCDDGSTSGRSFTFATGAGDSIDTGGTETCMFSWKIVADNVSSSQSETLTITPSDPYYSTLSFTVTINDGSDDDSSGGGGGGSTDETEDTHEIEFTSYPATAEVVQGQNKTVDIEIENTGSVDEEDLEIYISGIESSWYIAPDKFDLKELFDIKKSINFTIPEDARVKEYSIKYGIKNGDLDNSVDAKLKVLPSNKTIETINITYLETEKKVEELQELIDDLDLNDTQLNVTEEQLQTIKDKLQQAKDAIDAGDYFTAASLLAEIDELVESLKNSLGVEEDSGGLPTWAKVLIGIVVASVVIGAVGLLVYMLLPPKESLVAKAGVKVAVQTAQKEPLMKRLKDKLKNVFKRRPHGFHPGHGYVYKPK